MCRYVLIVQSGYLFTRMYLRCVVVELWVLLYIDIVANY